ncbi:PP2C family protein-serine/threonine phosphatase [Streptomyces sp. CNQ085]|uniref:PP2C family protein-serine/threonine phosphatase n=1 Tax=Streptomyces sp. CNQ085 TaxID=2886944 RepID=UPI001F514E7F|nr:PP2C family protein-serine/threonine phosphatase [Streptomyces sp. CNQ085]MCI0385972.1 serine/threonine-protein phosphatase [Streptomyces sp. CNQ085]
MTISEDSSTRPRGAGPGTAWDDAPCAAVAVDPSGAVAGVNTAAAGLFPDAVPGARLEEAVPCWLADAHRRLSASPGSGPGEAPRGEVGGRSLRAHPARDGNGEVVWWLVDDTELRLAEEALRNERKRTAFLVEVSETLSATLNVERCMEATVRLAVQHLADAAVLVAPAAGRGLPVAYGTPEGPAHGTVEADPETVPGLSEALRGFPPVPSRWIDPALLPDWAVPPRFGGTAGSAMVTPLPGHGVPAGALILLRRTEHTAFSRDEETFARLFAARAGAALSAARLYAEQAAVTATLMRELFPPKLRRVHGIEFAGGYRASEIREWVGGDFYDLHPAAGPEEESLIVLGDVCGKGLEAAVLTGKIRNTLHALLPMADDHPRVLGLLNGALVSSHHTRFATLVLASAARVGSHVRLRLTSAGHPAPLIVRADGSVEEADTRGSLIGVLPKVRARTATVGLAPGETCLLYTDGVTEARGGPLGGDMFGEERLKEALGECAAMPAEAVVERVRMLVGQWVGGRSHDDMAVVAITAPRTVRPGAVDGHARGGDTV